MDRLGLIALREEMREDCRIFGETASEATAHLEQGTHGRLQATAFELARAYNIIEQMGVRVARSFENNLPKDGGWHEALLRRMTLHVPGVRPALFGADLRRELDELRRFRHLVNHAYDVKLREDRMSELATIAGKVASNLGAVCETFVREVAVMQGWTLEE